MNKRTQIQNYFDKLLLDMEVLARSKDVAGLYAKLVEYHVAADTKADGPYDVATPRYKKIWEEDGANILRYFEDSGVYDVFMVCAAHGHVMYSCAKESDLGTNLGHGPLKESHLAKLWSKVKATDGRAVVDFEPYAPSNGEPAAFAGAPIHDTSGTMVGMMIVQLPLDQINAIMQERDGLGETGETYLVGSDKLMRSDSFLDPVNRSVVASFRDPSKGSVDTESVRGALAGKDGQDVIIDYNGNPVLSCYDPLQIDDLTWAIVGEIDVAEAFCPKDEAGKYFFEKYNNMYGYYDLFLLNPDGYCFYTVCHEADYQTNLVDGKYADSGLGKAVRECLSTKEFAFGDFAPYAPSAGAPAAFIAQPVLHGGKVDLVVALQLSETAISGMMESGSNKERTLEAYLVGPDGYMRSDSILNPDGYSIAASFGQGNKVDTEATRSAHSGGTDARVIKDYLGSSVLSAWAPLDIFGTKWALICEIDEAVAMAAKTDMDTISAHAGRQLVLWIAGGLIVVGLVVALLAWSIARSVSKPLTNAVESLTSGAEQVTAASNQVAQSSTSMAEGASEQASSLEETSASIEEITAMTRQNTENSKQASSLAAQAQSDAETGSEAMDRMGRAINEIKRSADETAGIVKTIEEIAFQTNLLALNAAVEAARAGDAGKGFAVVAEEVRNLAQRAAEAARSTGELITGSVKNAENGVAISKEVGDSLAKIAEAVGKVNQVNTEVASASQEQAQGIEQVNTGVAQMNQVTQANAANSEEGAAAAEELSAQAAQMMQVVDDLATLVGGIASRNGATVTVPHTTHAPAQCPAPERRGPAKALPQPTGNRNRQVVDAEQAIALDATDLEEF